MSGGHVAALAVLQLFEVCFSPSAFWRLLWLLGLGMVGVVLTIVLVLAVRVPLPLMPELLPVLLPAAALVLP